MEIFIVWIVYIHFEQIMYLRHERLCDNDDYCDVEMSTKNTNKLKYREESALKGFAVI